MYLEIVTLILIICKKEIKTALSGPPLFDNWAWLRKIHGYALEIVGGQ